MMVASGPDSMRGQPSCLPDPAVAHTPRTPAPPLLSPTPPPLLPLPRRITAHQSAAANSIPAASRKTTTKQRLLPQHSPAVPAPSPTPRPFAHGRLAPPTLHDADGLQHPLDASRGALHALDLSDVSGLERVERREGALERTWRVGRAARCAGDGGWGARGGEGPSQRERVERLGGKGAACLLGGHKTPLDASLRGFAPPCTPSLQAACSRRPPALMQAPPPRVLLMLYNMCVAATRLQQRHCLGQVALALVLDGLDGGGFGGGGSLLTRHHLGVWLEGKGGGPGARAVGESWVCGWRGVDLASRHAGRRC